MGLISKTIPGLYNGVSQQPASLRLPTQCELQENVHSSLVDGLVQRFPTKYINTLSNSNITEKSCVSFVNRDDSEKYFMAFTGDANKPLEIYSTDGTECSIEYENDSAKSYITSTHPKKELRTISVGDHSFVTNRTKLVSMSDTLSDPQIPYSLIAIKTGAAGYSYRIWINGKIVGTCTPSASDINAIADGLSTSLISSLGSNSLVITFNSFFMGIFENGKPPEYSMTLTLENLITITVPYQYSTWTSYEGGWPHIHCSVVGALTAESCYAGLKSKLNTNTWDLLLKGSTIYITKVGSNTFTYAFSDKYGGSFSTITAPGTTPWLISHTPNTNYIHISRTDGADFISDATDNYNNGAIINIHGSTSSFSNLPAKAPKGTVVEITGTESNDFDSYYVNFTDNSVWKETVKPGIKIKIDPSTMPHKIARIAKNTFKVSPIEWDKRLIGDDDSAPLPSFIGTFIEDIYFFKNRLGFLAGDSIIMSRSGSYYNFFPTTALDILDDDPIDLSAPTNYALTLCTALPSYNANLLVDSGTQQFIVSSGDNLFTVNSVTIDAVTAFTTNTACHPISAGPNAYFAVPDGKYAHIREYFIQADTLINDAADITAHVPHYLPKNINQLIANSVIDCIFALNSDELNTIYVYKYFWNGNEKIQSSWSRWTFDDEILGLATFENYVYLIQRKDSQIFLSLLDLSKATTGDLDFRIYLDKLASVTGTYVSTTNKTTWALPYTDSNTDFLVINGNTGSQIKTLEKTSSTVIEAEGDFSNVICYIGKPFESRYRFSELVIKTTDTNVADLSIKIQLKTLTLSYTNTNHFKLEITPKGRTTISQAFSADGTTLLSGNKLFFLLSAASGTSIDIVSNSYLPFEIQTATFQGIAVKLSGGVSG